MNEDKRLTIQRGVLIHDEFLAALKALLDVEWNRRDAYAVMRLLQQAESEKVSFENARFKRALELGEQIFQPRDLPNGAVNPDRGKPFSPPQYRVKPEHEEQFKAEMVATVSEHVEIYLNHKLTLPESATIKPKHLFALQSILDGPTQNVDATEPKAE